MFNPFRALKSWYGMKRLRRIFRLLDKSGLLYEKGGVRLRIDAGYQPTEAIKTQPPDVSSGVQPPIKVKSFYDKIILKSPNCEGVIIFPKAEGEKKNHMVYIPLETAKRLIEKKRIPRLEKHVPLPVKRVVAMSSQNRIEYISLYCPSCGFPLTTTSINEYKMCLRCRQRLERIEVQVVTKDA